MNRNGIIAALIVIVVGLFWQWSSPPSVSPTSLPDSAEAIEQGRYLVHAGGCISCHQNQSDDDDSLSGGHALESPFGTFHVSNITPDDDTGIGGWSGEDFILALRHGRAPEGVHYYPAFPYRSYAGISDEEALAIGAWLMSRPAVRNEVPEHELPGWISRWQMRFWNLMADVLQEEPAPVGDDPQLQRGAHLARDLGHCGECHTPRNALGVPDMTREFAGAELVEGDSVPAIDAQALSDWTEEDFELLLFLGMLPDGDYVGGDMGDVVEHNTAELTEEDRKALSAFFIRGLQ
ncbi:MAG: c-type cytochrome [Pseudomonadota bacterium]